MRVLYAITKGEVGGAQEHVRILASSLLALGHAVAIAAPVPSDLASSIGTEGAEVFPWTSITRNPNPVHDLRARRDLRSFVERFRPDVVHLHSSKAGVVGRGLVRRPGVTIFTCHHAPYGPRRQWSHRIVSRPIDQVTLPKLDGIISVGARDMPLLRKLAPRVPMRLIRNAVPFAGPPVGPPPNHTAVWVARLQPPKEPVLAVRAWADVVRGVPDARLIVCGTGPLEQQVRDAAARSAVSEAIDVMGFADDVRAFHAQASVYVLATRVEGGTTMATLDAMTQGLVPVLSDAGDAFLLEHARCGVVVQPGSAQALAESLVALFRSPERLSSMRERALDFSRRQWTVDDMVGATVDFYHEVLGAA